jgi:hypothetical protein
MKAKPKGANLRPPSRCIFCDGLGLTKEHMWANWLRSYIPREMEEHRIGSALVWPTESKETVERRTGDPHSRKIRCVCRACNNGWMSRLQQDAKPYFIPLLTGQSTALHKRAQTLLAGWTAMMVMVAEHIDSEMVGISPADRCWLYENRRPPTHWRIWIGRHRREAHPLFVHNVLPFAVAAKEIERPEGADRAANTQTSTICLGDHLVIHVISSQIGRSLIRRWKLPIAVAPVMSQIWPVRASIVKWPPPASLSDAGIDLLAQQFFNAAAACPRSRLGNA